jgi:hypothetical protein
MGGGNSRMMLENRITNNVENNVKNHVNMVNETAQNVTQSYIDKIKNSTVANQSITQVVRVRNAIFTGNSKLNVNQKARIGASLIAQNSVTNNRTDRTNLAAVMSSALQQAVISQAEMDTAQKAVNVMEQLDQNDGGIEGIVGKMADTASSIMGGNNTEQDIKNIMESNLRNNTNNSLNMDNFIETNLKKEFGTNTQNVCKSDLAITQVAELENITTTDNAEININQDAALDSAVECFNAVFNISDIATDISAASSQTTDQALDNISAFKSKQDIDNNLKQTKIQKNILSSLGGSCGMMVVLIIAAAVVIPKVLGGGKGGSGSDSGSDSKKKKGVLGIIFTIFILLFLGAVIYLLIVHRDAFKGSKAAKRLTDAMDKINPNTYLTLEEQNDGSFKIFNVDKTMQLVVIDSNKHPSQKDVEDRPDSSKNLEFTTDIENSSTFLFKEIVLAPVGTTSGIVEDDKEQPKLYKILTGDSQYQLGLLYSDNVRSEGEATVVEPVLYKVSEYDADSMELGFKFSVSPNPDEDSDTGHRIEHVNKITEDNDVELDSIAALQISDKPLNGGQFRKDEEYEVMGVEFRFD